MGTKTYFSPAPDKVQALGASERVMLDAMRFSEELGFRQVVTGGRSSPAYSMRLLSSRARASVFLTMYPYFCPPSMAAHRLRGVTSAALRCGAMLAKRTVSVLYIVDLPLEQRMLSEGQGVGPDPDEVRFERRLFDEFDVLCVFNERMERAVKERHGSEGRRFVRFEILDYGSSVSPPRTKTLGDERVIVHAGASADEGSLGLWPRDVPHEAGVRWMFFGRGGHWLQGLGRKDIAYEGFVHPEQLERTMADEAHFGIIGRNPDTGWSEYHDFGSTSKLPAYMTCGVPVLVPSQYRYISELVAKYGVGWTFGSFDEVPGVVASVTQEEYDAVRGRVLELGEKLRKGHFFKRAVAEALEA